MTDPPKKPEKKPRSRKKTLLILAAVTVVFVLALITAVLFVPFLVSSDRSRKIIEEKASETLKRPIRIEQIQWTWTDGIMLQGILLEDDPGFSDKPLFYLAEAKIKIDFFELAGRTAVINVAVNGLDARLIRNEDGLTNIEKLLSALEAKEPPPAPSGEKTVLPGNLRCGIRLENISIFVDDRASKTSLAVKNASVKLEIPSLLDKPVRLAVASDLEMNGQGIPPVDIGLTVAGLFQHDGAINLQAVKTDFAGKLPGASVTLNADVAKSEVRANVDADLAELAELAKPFLPPEMAEAVIAGPVNIRAFVKNAFDVERGLKIKTAHVETDGSLPGIRFSINGGLAEQKAECNLSVDLPKVANLARPFIPKQFAETVVAGSVGFLFQTTGDPQKGLVFDLDLKTSELLVSGGPVGNGSVGPADLALSARGDADPISGSLAIGEGVIRCFENTEIRFSGEARQHPKNMAEANFRAGPARVDIGEFIAAAGPLLPPNLPDFQDVRTRPPVLEFEKIRLAGNVNDGPKTVDIDTLALTVPAVRVESEPNTVQVGDFSFKLANLSCTLEEFFPKSLELLASIDIGAVNIKGDQDLAVKKIAIPKLSVKSGNISKPEKSLFGAGGDFTISETLQVGEITIPSLAALKNVGQSLDTVVGLPGKETAKIAVRELKLDLPSVSVKTPEYGTIKTTSAIRATVGDIAIRNLDPPHLDIANLDADLKLGNFLSAKINADTKNTGKSRLKTKGNMTVRLRQLAKAIPSKLLKNPKLGGEAAIEWKVSGRLPTDRETQNLEKLESFDPKKDLTFLSGLDFACDLRDVIADVNLPDGEIIKIGPVTTRKPVTYAYHGNSGEGEFEGVISLQKIAALPSVKPSEPVSLDLAFNARHDGIRSVTLRQSLEADILNLKENLDLSLSGGERIFVKNLNAPPPLWLKYLGGKIECGMSVSKAGKPETVLKGIALSGHLDAGADIKLAAGRDVEVNAKARTRDISVRAEGLADVNGLRTDLKVDRSYQFRFDKKSVAEKGRTEESALSAEVLKADMAKAAGSVDESAAVSGFIDQMQSRYAADHTLSFNSARVATGPLPLNIGACQADLDLSGTPNLNHFQVDILGGTAMGETSFYRENNEFSLKAKVSFSGIDTRTLFPGVLPESKDEDAELTGRLSLALPLTTSMDIMLQRVILNLRFSHIGARALEWILYSLDPTESDEAIVSLRMLLKTGSPRWISVEIRDGALSLDGEINAKGVPISIPRIERLNIANLSELRKYEKDLAAMQPLVDILKLSLAQIIVITEDGDVSVTR